jgi:hypothetical protein
MFIGLVFVKVQNLMDVAVYNFQQGQSGILFPGPMFITMERKKQVVMR